MEMLQKLPILSKKASNRNYSELNLLQKIQGRICVSHPGLSQGAPKIAKLKKIHFRAQLKLNAAKTTDYV